MELKPAASASGPRRRVAAASLSPSKTRTKRLSSTPPVPVPLRKSSTRVLPRCALAMSRSETVLVTATGDVLVCRSRNSPYGNANDDLLIAEDRIVKSSSGDMDLFQWWDPNCHQFSQAAAALCNPWAEAESGPGLLGGAVQVKADVVPSDSEPKKEDVVPVTGEITEDDKTASIDHNLAPEGDVDESILPLPSFDYSHFADGGNDMEPMMHRNTRTPLPTHLEENISPAPDYEEKELVLPPVLHGVPTFLPAFSHVRITKVSAHPLGSHVLLISAEALLFSYGLNDHGQLGMGRKTAKSTATGGFVTTPTIVTPLLENGGKAIMCAAGVDHSLVVIKTDGRRVKRLKPLAEVKGTGSIEMARVTSSPSRIDTDVDTGDAPCGTNDSESVRHHQLYAFGRNNCKKLGLVNPDENAEDDVLLPHRVALHCKVWPGMEKQGLPASGIFAVAASSHHSAALVHRATGAIELYAWGNSSEGELGFRTARDVTSSTSSDGLHNGASRKGVIPFPTLVPALSFQPVRPSRSNKIDSDSKSSPETVMVNDYPVGISLGPKSTFVVTSSGRCVSFGSSHDGLLGLGTGAAACPFPRDISFPPGAGNGRPKIMKVSVGARHVVAVAKDGSVYAWGLCTEGRTGLDSKNVSSPTERMKGTHAARIPEHSHVVWKPRLVRFPDISRPLPEAKENEGANAPPRCDDRSKVSVVDLCAGYDSTVFVTNSGCALTCGKSSGRLGRGESNTDELVPTKIFGGLHLWR